jgi:hypothetical protein
MSSVDAELYNIFSASHARARARCAVSRTHTHTVPPLTLTPIPPARLPAAYYSLHSDPLDPEHIRAFQLVKLAEDCQLISSGRGVSVSEADAPLLKADVYVAFTAEVTRAEKIAPGQGMERSALMMAPTRPAASSAISADRRKVRRATNALRAALPTRSPPTHTPRAHPFHVLPRPADEL